MEPISVLLIDDNPTFLRATNQFLDAHDDLVVVGTANRGEEGLAQVQGLNPQVILVDLAMIGLSGLEVIPRLRKMMPNVGIITLTLLNTENFRQAALKAGANGFVPKATMRTQLVPMIRRVVQADHANSNASTLTASDNGADAKRRILIIEDNADLRRLYSKALRKVDFEVRTAGSIQQAYDLLDKTRFDVLLCDIHMGDGQGTDLLNERADALATRGTRIIMVSGQSHYRAMCNELGADFFLEKPVSVGTLVALVNRLAAR